MTQPSRVSLVAAFAAVYIIWGSTYLAIRWGVAEIPPFLMAGGRFLGAGLVFVLLGVRGGAARPTTRDWVDDRAHRNADGGRRQRGGQLGVATRAVRHRRVAGLDGPVLVWR